MTDHDHDVPPGKVPDREASLHAACELILWRTKLRHTPGRRWLETLRSYHAAGIEPCSWAWMLAVASRNTRVPARAMDQLVAGLVDDLLAGRAAVYVAADDDDD
jgi:hypothetical protein